MSRLLRSKLQLFTILVWFLGIAGVDTSATAQRAIPEDNLAYPVLVKFASSTGSGFYVNASDAVYLVTAKHVLIEPDKKTLRENVVELLSYAKNFGDAARTSLTLDLVALRADGNVRAHATEDVVVVKVAVFKLVSSLAGLGQHELELLRGVTGEFGSAGIVGVDLGNIKKFDQVLVGNDIVMFGYPTSLSLIANPKIDFTRPLLRKGMVAGENLPTHSIILDCLSYQGDSGGPIIEVDIDNPFQRSFKVIGVMSSFVPFADTWVNQHFGYTNTTLENSGYSVITPMDFVLDLLK